MGNVIVRHKVADYTKWKSIFDSHLGDLKVGGCTAYHLLKNPTDSKDLTVVCEFESLEKAHRFFESEKLRKGMAEAGLIGKPEIQYFEELECKSADEFLKKVA